MKYCIKRFYKGFPDNNLKGTVTCLVEYKQENKLCPEICSEIRMVWPWFHYDVVLKNVHITDADYTFEADDDRAATKTFLRFKDFVK